MERESSREEAVRKMAELLRSGATMLAETCPICGSPLFRLKSGEIICPTHGRVYIVSKDEEISRISTESVLNKLESLASKHIDSLMRELSEDNELEVLESISRWLDILLKIRAIRRESSEKKI
ncbi:MAG: Sjogren's syndrome/scleroderma autoantigen 1 family protein [Sulfolobales archaeon]